MPNVCLEQVVYGKYGGTGVKYRMGSNLADLSYQPQNPHLISRTLNLVINVLSAQKSLQNM